MNQRIRLGKLFIRAGSFIQSLAVVVMRPVDLVEFNRLKYASPSEVSAWGAETLAAAGLTAAEKDLFARLPIKQGRLLLLGLGGGRDAIALAKMGFDVVGVDFIPELVAQAQENAARHGVSLKGVVQEISQLEFPPASFDLGLISAAMYSCLPTRERRVAMLTRIKTALKPGGYFLCQFILDPEKPVNPRAQLARKVFAFLTRGNRWLEPGDVLKGPAEYLHIFLSPGELRSEFAAAGFAVLYFQSEEFGTWRGAVLQRPA